LKKEGQEKAAMFHISDVSTGCANPYPSIRVHPVRNSFTPHILSDAAGKLPLRNEHLLSTSRHADPLKQGTKDRETVYFSRSFPHA
jgi:hypothetical protein